MYMVCEEEYKHTPYAGSCKMKLNTELVYIYLQLLLSLFGVAGKGGGDALQFRAVLFCMADCRLQVYSFRD